MQITFNTMYPRRRDYLQRIHIHIIFLAYSLAPLEKLITSDKLAFIPNLYYQQYRLLDILNSIRSDYPEQKILVPRQFTTHDKMMEQMRRNHFLLEQELKYRKAMCFQLAKSAKEEFFKKKLKKQEKYLFHRVAFSQLAQAVKIKFDQLKPNSIDKKQEKENHKKSKPQADDIFIDNKEDSNLIGDPDGDLLDGIFSTQKNQVPVEEPVVVKIFTIEDYIQTQADNDNKLKECRKILNRKNCLKKINDNIRKRIKSKLNQEAGEKNLNSATVLITNLISSQADPKQGDMQNQQQFIEVPAQTQFLSSVQQRPKKKKQQVFQLKWTKESLEEFNQKNSKFQINKSKFDLNYLTMSMVKDEKQYEKTFAKNINRQHFPPSLNSIPQLYNKFSEKPYYNTSADRQYEKFILKYNKKAQFQKFKQISKYAVVENLYGNESQPSNISKIFLNPQKIESSISDRVIYKVSNGRLIPASAVYRKANLSKQELLLLSFLVRRYLGIFGSNWQVITMLILTNPNFSNMFLNTEQIQELYQIVKDKNTDTLIQQINMMNKKILPASLFVNSSYQQMDPTKNLQTIFESQQMTDEAEERQYKDFNKIQLDDYQRLIDEPLTDHEDPKQYVYHNTAKAYDAYIKNVSVSDVHDYQSTLTQSLGLIINQFEGKTEVKYVEAKEPAKFSQCSDWVLEKVKNEIKFNTPVRKRKNITDKSSELVKILHTLKQKLQNPVRQTAPPTASRPTVAANGPVPDAARTAASQAPTPTPTPPPSQTQAPVTSTIKKTLPKAKPEDKKQKGPPKQQKQRKKKPGKDGDKDGQSK